MSFGRTHLSSIDDLDCSFRVHPLSGDLMVVKGDALVAIGTVMDNEQILLFCKEEDKDKWPSLL